MLKLSSLPADQVQKYWDYYNNMLLTGKTGFTVIKPTALYNADGLRFPTDYLQKIGFNVIFFPLELMKDYADMVTVDNCRSNNEEFSHAVLRELYSINPEDFFQVANATSFGNLAHCVLHSFNPSIRQACEEFLDKCFEIAEKKLKEYMKTLPEA